MSIKGNTVEIYNLPNGCAVDSVINKAQIRKIYRSGHFYTAKTLEDVRTRCDFSSTFGINALMQKYGREEDIPYPVRIIEDWIYVEYVDGKTEGLAGKTTLVTNDQVELASSAHDLDMEQLFRNLCRQLDGYSIKRENDGWSER